MFCARKIPVLLFCCLCFSCILSQNYPSLIPYRKDTLWGYCDSTGKIIANPQFKGANAFYPGQKFAFVFKADKRGLISDKGVLILPVAYDNIFFSKNPLIAAIKNKSVELFNPDGSKFNDVIYDGVDYPGTIDHLLLAFKGNATTAFNARSGKKIFQVPYEILEPFTHGVAIFTDGRKFGLIDTNGKILMKPLYHLSREKSRLQSSLSLINIENNGKYGLADIRGTILFEPVYDEPIANYNTGDLYGRTKTNSRTIKLGLYKLIPPEITYTSSYLRKSRNGYFIHIINKQKSGMLNSRGKIILPVEFENIYTQYRADSVAVFFVKKNERWGVADTNGKIVIPISHDKAEMIHLLPNGSFIVHSDSLTTLLEENGKALFSSRYNLYPNGNSGFFNFSMEKKWGLLDRTGKIIAPANYNYIKQFTNGKAVFSKDNKMGFLDLNGKELSDPGLFDGIGQLEQTEYYKEQTGGSYPRKVRRDVYTCELNGRRGLIVDKKLIIPCIYKWVRPDNYPVVGLIDTLGNFIFCDSTGKKGSAYPEKEIKLTEHTGTSPPFFYFHRNESMGVIGKTAAILVPPDYKRIQAVSAHTQIFVCKRKDSLVDVYTFNGKKLEEFSGKYDTIQLSKWGNTKDLSVFEFRKKNKKGLVDTLGNIITPAQYESVYGYLDSLGNRYFLVIKDHKTGILDSKGKEILAPEFHRMSGISDDRFFLLMKENKYGVCDYTGNFIISCEYDKIEQAGNYFILKKNDTYSIYNWKTKKRTDCKPGLKPQYPNKNIFEVQRKNNSEYKFTGYMNDKGTYFWED
jgi:hypothetical protein